MTEDYHGGRWEVGGGTTMVGVGSMKLIVIITIPVIINKIKH